MAISSKVEVCNLALSELGNTGSVNDIDSPVSQKEIVCALWYDITRQTTLKKTMPNFALARRLVGELVVAIPFGYEHAYERPVDCLKVLGLGDVDQKDEYPFSVEGNYIYTDDAWDDGLELRFIRDVTDVNSMTPEFILQFAKELAANICLPITQNDQRKALLQQKAQESLIMTSGLNAQENKPIRKSVSRFRAARYGNFSRNPTKR